MRRRRYILQIEEKKFAHRRGSEVTNASRPINISHSPLIIPMNHVDNLPEPGSLSASFKLVSLPPSALNVEDEPIAPHDVSGMHAIPKPDIPGVIHGMYQPELSTGGQTDACDKDSIVISEYTEIFESFRKCLELRDKYMTVSGQMLGFNPKDHDGHFIGLDSRVADVSGVRPDVDLTTDQDPPSLFKPWQIYPRPPRPHWHWTNDSTVRHHKSSMYEDEEFYFEHCEIPGPDPSKWDFQMDERGVYQVYDTSKGIYSCIKYHITLKRHISVQSEEKTPVFSIPTIREYFIDLEYVLSVISNGPTKSFAYRRLGYLSSKFTMYSLLNEFQELADIKVRISLIRRPI
jgi:AMP deaminase